MDKSLYEFGQEMARIMPKFLGLVMKKQGKALSAGNITVQQMFILNILKHESPMMMSRLARNMNLTTSAVTGLVTRMVRSGYLKRITDEKDRRIIYIEMTKKAGNIIDKIEQARYQMIMDMFKHVTELERKRYLETLKKIVRTTVEAHE